MSPLYNPSTQSHGAASSLWLPTGAKAETFTRNGARIAESLASLSTGRLAVYAITLPANTTINTITFWANGAGSAMTNQWFVLADASLNVLGKTNDDTSTAWGAGTSKTLTLASPYTTTAEMAAYIGVVVVGTPPTLYGATSLANITIIAPAMSGTSTTGLTNPASLGGTIAALSQATTTGTAWAYVS